MSPTKVTFCGSVGQDSLPLPAESLGPLAAGTRSPRLALALPSREPTQAVGGPLPPCAEDTPAFSQWSSPRQPRSQLPGTLGRAAAAGFSSTATKASCRQATAPLSRELFGGIASCLRTDPVL